MLTYLQKYLKDNEIIDLFLLFEKRKFEAAGVFKDTLRIFYKIDLPLLKCHEILTLAYEEFNTK